MEAIVLAGGMGTRLRSVVSDLPKPMAPIHGRPFLSYQLDYWIVQGVERFILSVGYQWQIISRYFGNQYKGKEIVYVVEDRPCGTGGGVLLAIREMGHLAPFLILNGDTYFEVDLHLISSFHQQKGADVTIGLRNVAVNQRYSGVQLDEEGRILAFEPRVKNATNLLINGGVYLTNKVALFNEKWRAGDAFSIEDDLFPHLCDAGRRFYGFISAGDFIDIGIPEDYHAAAFLLKTGAS